MGTHSKKVIKANIIMIVLCAFIYRKMLTSAGAFVKHLNMETLSQNVYIQHFKNIKVVFPTINLSFISFLDMLNKCPGGTV
jgi:hypothetical protein